MDYFESPAWDGDITTENLTIELFHSSNVGKVKVPKKRKRNKYPKGTSKGMTPNSIKLMEVKMKPIPGKGKSTNPIPANISKDRMNTGLLQKEDDFSPKKNNKNKAKSEPRQGSGVHHKNNVKSKRRKTSLGTCVNSIEGNDSIPTLNSEPSPSSPSPKSKKKKKNPMPARNQESYPEGLHNFKDLKDQLDLIVNKYPVCKEDVHDKDILINSFIGKKMGSKAEKIPQNENSNELVEESENVSVRKEPGNSKNNKLDAGRSQKKKNIQEQSGLKKSNKKKMAAGKLSGNALTPHATKGSLVSMSGFMQSSPYKKSNDGEEPVAKKNNNKSGKNKILVKELSQSVGAVSVGRKTSLNTKVMPTTITEKKRKHPEDKNCTKEKIKISKKVVEDKEDIGIESEDEYLQKSSSHTVQKEKRRFSLGNETNNINNSENNVSVSAKKKNLSLREKMIEKLRSARFRYMNEQMCTSKSDHTSNFFQFDQKAFKAYHVGYKQQLMLWPVKPIELIVQSLRKKPATHIIADFGCGDAQISRSIKNKVYSFDHVALNKYVTACNMAHTPLSNASVDIVVFCLSLMGKNLSDYIFEANRVLKIGGLMKIAEVESRFDKVETFVKDICKFGFLCIRRDLSNDVFYLFDFRKEKSLIEGRKLPTFELRACTYKKR